MVSFAIIRGSNGRRHEVNFEDAEITVDIAIGAKLCRSRSKPPTIRHHPTSVGSPPFRFPGRHSQPRSGLT